MKEMLKIAAVLTVISLVSAGILAVTERGTREPIARAASEKKKLAREALVPSASFESFLPEVFPVERAEKTFMPVLAARGLSAAFLDCYRKEGAFFLLRNGVAEDKRTVLLETLARTGQSKFFFADLIALARKAGPRPYNHLANLTRIYTGFKNDGSLSGFVFECFAPEGYGGNIEMVTGIVLQTNGEPAIRDYIVIKSGETPGLGKKAEDTLHATVTNPAAGVRMMSNYSPDNREKDVISGATITSMAIKDALYASLQYGATLKDQLAPSAEIPQNLLLLVPYGGALERIASVKNPLLHALYNAKFYAQVMGQIALIPLRSFNPVTGINRRLMLAAGIQTGGKLTLTRLFEYDAAGKAWGIIPDGNLGFFNTTEADLIKIAALEKDPARKAALDGILAAYAQLRTMGR